MFPIWALSIGLSVISQLVNNINAAIKKYLNDIVNPFNIIFPILFLQILQIHMKMVRVLSVYHFDDGDQQNQNIGIGDEIIDTCMVGDNKIAVATPNMNVEIWDMSSNPQQQTIFPTVDEVKQICYCQNGNYFATLETKLDARNKTLSFVRIYTNWDSIEQNSEVMINFRARIAGKTTPSEKYLSSNDLEMIELPIKVHPTRIACCQVRLHDFKVT